MSRFRDRRRASAGQILVLFALSLIVVLAGMAVVLDGGRVYAERRKTQNAADAAAMAGAAKLVKADPGGSLPAVLAAACAAAFANGSYGTGAVDGQCGTFGTVVQVHVPGSEDGGTMMVNVNPKFENPGYVQVGITTSFRSFMSGILGLSNFAASALAVAVNSPGNGLGDAKILVLDPSSCGVLQLNGSNVVNVTGGDVQVDSSAAKSSDAACTNKNAATTSGGATLNNAGGLNYIVGSGDTTGVTPAWAPAAYKADPLTRVTVPPFDNTALSPADLAGGTWNAPSPWTAMGTATARPGVYWGGITVTNGDTLTLSGGTYIMAGGGFNIQGGTVTGTDGVTLIYTMDPYCNSSAPSGCSPSAQKSGDLDGSHLNGNNSSVGQGTSATAGSWGTPLSALRPQVLNPDPYSLTNILIYVDRKALVQDSSPGPCPNTTLNIGGNGYFNFATGSIIYAPCSVVNLHGTSVPPSQGGAVVSWQVVISGTKDLNLGGPAAGSYPTAQSNLVQ